MSPFSGIQVHPSPLMTERKVIRVPGGYMNHWLIRAEVEVPSRRIIHDRLNGRIYCHPAMLNEISRLRS